MSKCSSTKVSIYKYNISFNRGLKLIERFKRVNNIDFQLELKLDFAEKYLGYYNYNSTENIIYINPIRCTHQKKNNLLGHPSDCSIYATITHELAHFLDLKFKLVDEYTSKNFALKHLYLSSQGKENKIEEIAELISIYLINPYYLKLADIERYNWIKGKFKSPMSCGKKSFMKYYIRWSEEKQIKFVVDHGML